MTYYRIKDNKIVDSGNFKYSKDCLETDKNILTGFDGKLYFEEEMQTGNYKQRLDLYNAKKQIETRINELISLLKKSDYKALQFAEGELSAEDFLPIKQKRIAYRLEINSLEEKLKNL